MNNGFYGFPNVLGVLRATTFKALGKAGATNGAALAGGTPSGAPAAPAGPFDVGDLIVDASGALWVCSVAGTSVSSPGTFVQAGFANPLTTKADLIVAGTAGAASRLGVGSDNQVLTADSTQTLGLKWAAATGSGGVAGNVSSTGAGGSEPGSPAAGDLYFPTGSFYVERYSGSAWAPWGPLCALTKPPVLSNWTWVNQGSATASDLAGGGIYLSVTNTASEVAYLLKKAAPATPYTITAALVPLLYPAATAECGLLFRESGSGNLVEWRLNYTGVGATTLSATKTGSTGAGVANYTPAPDATLFGRQPLWLRLADNGTNRISSVSADGQNWLQIHSVGRTDYLTANEVGFFVGGNSSNVVGLTLLSWAQT